MYTLIIGLDSVVYILHIVLGLRLLGWTLASHRHGPTALIVLRPERGLGLLHVHIWKAVPCSERFS